MNTGVKRNTKRIGDISELRVMMALIEAGYFVAVPFGENQRWDLIIEKDRVLARVQVKTGRLRKGVVIFNTVSTHTHRGGPACRMYLGEIEFFGVYCPDTDGVYLLPIGEMTVTQGCLRVAPAKNGQTKRLRWADRYLLAPGRDDRGARSTEPEQLSMPTDAVVA